jgi:hypothetical protein
MIVAIPAPNKEHSTTQTYHVFRCDGPALTPPR